MVKVAFDKDDRDKMFHLLGEMLVITHHPKGLQKRPLTKMIAEMKEIVLRGQVIQEPILKWYPYPETTPDEGSMDVIIITTEFRIEEVFYQLEDAKHDHSPWNKALWWTYSDMTRRGKKRP